MDIVAHGLWGGALFYKRKGYRYWLGFLFGVLPDLISFVPQLAIVLLSGESFPSGRPSLDAIRPFTFMLYNITHSIIIFGVMFALISWIRKKPLWELGAWGLHILFDIPTHTAAFFPTPFLWPFSEFKLSGISWGHQWFMVANYCALGLTYIFLSLMRRRRPPIA